MGRTPFYRTLNELEHHFLNIERTRMCSSIGDWTRTPYFCFRMLEHETSNLIGLSIDLLYSWTHSNIIFSNVERTWTCSSIGNRTSNTLILASNDWTSNFEPSLMFELEVLKLRLKINDLWDNTIFKP